VSAVATRPAAEVPVVAMVERPHRRRWTSFILPGYFWLVILYTVAPIIVMIVYSFNKAPAQRVTFAWQGFTTEWYRHPFEVSDLTSAMIHSLTIATFSSLIATAVGIPMALAMGRYRFRGKGVSEVLIFADIAAPSVVVGASLLGFFITLNWNRGPLTILITHVAFNVAFVVVVIRARVEGLGRTLEEAAQDLGATPWVTFRKVTFPLIFPGILAAFLLAFALSIDDFIITSFVNGQYLTFPLWVFGAAKVGIPPQVFVLGTLIFVAGVVIAVTNVVLGRERRVQIQEEPA
jgi:spermidine/putrescine transport system permease protein